jgi:hypothetical protein
VAGLGVSNVGPLGPAAIVLVFSSRRYGSVSCRDRNAECFK